MEYLGRGHAVDIPCFPVGPDQLFITGTMGQDAKFDLGIIRIHKYISVLRHEYLADQAPELHPHRNILQVRFRAAQPSGGCHGLIEFPVDPSVRPDERGKPVRIGGLKLRQLPVLQDLRYERIIRRQLLQHIRRR